jgi:hypothetical protein
MMPSEPFAKRAIRWPEWRSALCRSGKNNACDAVSALIGEQMQLLRLISSATQQQWLTKYMAADRPRFERSHEVLGGI